MGYYIVLSGAMLFALIVVLVSLHQDKKEIHQPTK